MAKPKKPQTEEKAKGLLANVGNYKGRTLNLSKKEVAAAGASKAAKNTVSISNTNYDKTTKKVMSGGKALNGRVDLGGGNMAVYKNGVRIRAQKPVTRNVSPSSSSGTAQGATPARKAHPVDESKKMSMQPGAKPTAQPSKSGFGYGPIAKQTGLRTPEAKKPVGYRGGTKGTVGMAKAMVPLQTPRGAAITAGALLGGAAAAGLIPGAVGAAIGAGAARAGGAAARVAGAAGRGVVSRANAAAAGRALRKQGLGSVEGKAADRRVAAAVAKAKVKPSAAAPSAPKAAATTAKDIGATAKGVSKRTGGALKAGEPAKYGPKKPTAAQAAQSKRQSAAQKAAATRKANAAAAAKKKGK